ncbi:hypothetical protein WG66_016151 [Moniliophthora roreri]|uniref:Uncharacterized protein n=1 Tax=Moniliophthora roreri TaxID=221103 RepID=A0A0W0F307_MONRR|nr:hypothetical protein WG66_016151 [Moniliophthora roreri]
MLLNHVFVAMAMVLASAVNGQTWTAAFGATAALAGRDVATAATPATAATAALAGRDVATAALADRDVATAATAATQASAATAATAATQSAATTQVGNATAGAIYIPLNPLGDVAAAHAPSGNSFLFYQNSTNGDIMMARVSNAFTDGSTSFAGVVVPGNEVLWGTPIAVAQQREDGNDIGNLGLYFYSPNYTLSEYRYLGGSSPPWMGGPTCNSCVTGKNFKIQRGSSVLYAMGSVSREAKAGIRVGFISENFPDTISEADRNYGIWRLAPLPN